MVNQQSSLQEQDIIVHEVTKEARVKSMQLKATFTLANVDVNESITWVHWQLCIQDAMFMYQDMTKMMEVNLVFNTKCNQSVIFSCIEW